MVIFLLQIRVNSCIIHVAFAGVMELVDVVDSKSTAGDSVPVRVRSPAPSSASVPRNTGRSQYYPGVAQLVARLLWEQDAGGSSPFTPTKILTESGK